MAIIYTQTPKDVTIAANDLGDLDTSNVVLTGVDTVTHEGENSLSVVYGHQSKSFIHLDADNVGADTGFMLIDLSDTSNWPHADTGHLVLEDIFVNINPTTAFAGDIYLGFLSDVDATNGDLNVVHTYHIGRQALGIVSQLRFESYGMDLEATEWFGPIQADSVLWQTDVNLQGPDGNTSYPSGAGDFVMRVARTAGNVDVGIHVVYESRA